ncbi:MAG TPA: M20 family metallopeptidase [Clostridia bacterium]|nr:M20 family metallopeptidase [Clostridia bacterium]
MSNTVGSHIVNEVISRIEDNVDRLLNLLRALIQVDTCNPPGDYRRISEIVADEFLSLGLNVQPLQGQDGKPNIIGYLPGSQGNKTLLVSAHMDVVPVGKAEDWAVDPFGGEIIEGKIYGRGSADTKCGLACQVEALRAIRSAGVELTENLLLGATVDDETAGTMGMKYVIEKGLRSVGWPRPDRVLIGEPSDLAVVGAWKGRIWYEITLGGIAAHGGAPEHGVNAIDKMISLINEIKKMDLKSHPLTGHDSINIGTITGGTKINVVADECKATFDIRYGPPRKASEVDSFVRGVIKDLEKKDRHFRVRSVSVWDFRDPVWIDPEDDFVKCLLSCVREVTAREPTFTGSLSAGDLHHCFMNGIPGAWIGPGKMEVAHKPNEYVEISKLVAATKIYALAILKQCSKV